VVPNGVEPEFFAAPRVERGKWLVCSATITPRKRVLELAEAAVEARTPIWIVGRPYAETDAYANRFLELARAASDILRYEGAIQDRAKMAAIYREARGFVLLSTMETLSLSSLEAAACECPLLLSDLHWARTTFAEKATYCPFPAATANIARSLRTFYDSAPNLPVPEKPATWRQVAEQFRRIYERVLSTSR
jgi:glycosyltransferase involved in cell wall biosynthesis